jgi:hypothetical protein
MDSESSAAGSSFLQAVAEYRAAAERDPRRFACGYLAGDPATGARGAFLWFATPDELFGFLRTVEVDLLQFGADEAARIVANVRRATGRSSNLARVDRDALSAAFEGWCEILWIGTFADLSARGGTFATDVRAHFRADNELDQHAGPISDAEMNPFVAHLRRLFLAREDGRADRD